jgi:hypothetical protein
MSVWIRPRIPELIKDIFSYNLVNKIVLQGTVEILTENVGLIKKGVEAQTHQKPYEVERSHSYCSKAFIMYDFAFDAFNFSSF